MTTGVERRQGETAAANDISSTRGSVSSAGSRPKNAAFLFTVVALTITVVGLLYLIQTARVASLGYELTRLERERAAVALENQRLTHTVANYESLPAIERIAVDTLDMQPVSDYTFIIVPLPQQHELAVPGVEAPPEPSLAQRVWERLAGKSTVVNAGGSR